MPFELTWEPGGVYRLYFGRVTIDERRHAFNLICGDQRFDDLRYAITDYLSVESYEISTEATREIAALHVGPMRTNARIVIAAVAVQPDIIAAIEDFISLRYTNRPYRIFPRLDEARAWVGSL